MIFFLKTHKQVLMTKYTKHNNRNNNKA